MRRRPDGRSRKLGGGGLLAGDGVAQRGEVTLGRVLAPSSRASASRSVRGPTSGKRLAQRGEVGADGLAQLGELVGGRGVGEPLAQGLGAALDLLDALQRGSDLGAGGGALALAVALQALDGRGELGADRVRGLLVLGAHLLELGGDLGAVDRSVGTASGLGDRLGGAGLGGGDRLGQPGVGGAGLALERVDAGRQAGGAGLDRRLDPLQARLLLVTVELARHAGQRALQIGLQGRGVAVGRQRALVGLAAGLLELRGQRVGDALELVDALHRGEQAGDDRGGVVKIVEAALDARVGVGQALLGLGVGQRRARRRGGPARPRSTGSRRAA